MKLKGLFLCGFIVLYFFSNTLSATYNPVIFKQNYIEETDTIPTRPPGLFSRMAEVFKFKKYAQLKQKNAIINAIQHLGITDTIAATQANVLLLNTLLTSVKDSSDLNYNLLLLRIDSLKQNARKNNDSIYRQLHAFAQPPTNDEMADLAEKILPIIQNKITKSNTTAISGNPDTFHLIRTAFYYSNKKPDTASHQITRKADVYCFFSPEMDKNYLDFNFNILNNIIFNGYQLSDKNAFDICTNHLKNNRVLKNAIDNKCSVFLSLISTNNAITQAFLSNESQQKKVTDNLLRLISSYNIDGVNVMLGDVDYNYSNNFISFIRQLTQKIKWLTITIPAFDTRNGYDIDALNKLPVKSFILNFTSQKKNNINGPVVALYGPKYSMQAAVNRYLNATVPFQRLVISIPFYGVDFSYGEKYPTPHYNTLDNMSEVYADSSFYDSIAACVYAELTNLAGEVTREMWYDDDISLNNKYRFILNNNFGGIAIEPLKKSASIGYAGIWNGIAKAFFEIVPKRVEPLVIKRGDSCMLGNNLQQDAAIRNAMIQLGAGYCYSIITTDNAFFSKLKHLLTNSCGCLFSDSLQSISHYFDSVMTRNILKKDPFYYQSFLGHEAVSKDSTRVVFEKNKLYLVAFRSAVKRIMLHNTIVTLVLFLAALIYYFNCSRMMGYEWKMRRKIEIAAIALLNLLMLCGSLFFYLSNSPRNGSCIQMPLPFLLILIFTGMIIGSAFLYYKVFNLIRSEKTP